MQYTTLGKTGLKVSVAGLGCSNALGHDNLLCYFFHSARIRALLRK